MSSLHEMQAQMEAIQQMANNRTRGTFDSLSSSTPNINQSSSFNLLDPAMSNQQTRPPGMPGQPNPAQQQQQSQQRFLYSLHSFMIKRNTPLPQTLTGVPGTEAGAPMWAKVFQLGSDVGCIRLAGKDVNIFKLWSISMQVGGAAAINARGLWTNILSTFELPHQYHEPLLPTGSHSTVDALSQLHSALLLPFEELYKQNIQAQRQKAMQASQSPNAQPPGAFPTSAPPPSFAPQFQVPAMAPTGPSPLDTSASQAGVKSELMHSPEQSILDGTLKRKAEFADDAKRSRQKIEPTDVVLPSQDTSSTPSQQSQQPSRRKIQYVPLAREVDTYGGHDLKEIETLASAQRGLREIHDWGTVDLEALTLSLRSRLSIEISYALTTFSLLSIMRGAQSSGMVIVQAPDLVEELLDCLEDAAFPDLEDTGTVDEEPGPSNKQLLDDIFDAESMAFAPLKPSKPPAQGTMQAAHIILSITNILRNLVGIAENVGFLVERTRTVSLLLRLCGVSRADSNSWQPVSPSLNLSDLISVRRDVLYTLNSVALHLNFAKEGTDPSVPTQLTAKRAINLLSSYLLDPADSVAPSGCVQVLGVQLTSTPPPPPILADVALETLNRVAHTDNNRAILSKLISESMLWSFLECLVHRLPVADLDFRLLRSEHWLFFVEKVLLALYTIAFIAPPKFKARAKKDRQLAVPNILTRMIQKLTASPELRQYFSHAARRTIETLKMLDDALDSFDTGTSVNVTTLSFGMGYGEGGEGSIERGTGLLGARRDTTFEVLMQSEIYNDQVAFKELDSLARVDVW